MMPIPRSRSRSISSPPALTCPSITNLVFLRRVNSRILYEQMIGRATRPCPEIGKEVFRIFDAVDLYPHLAKPHRHEAGRGRSLDQL